MRRGKAEFIAKLKSGKIGAVCLFILVLGISMMIRAKPAPYRKEKGK